MKRTFCLIPGMIVSVLLAGCPGASSHIQRGDELMQAQMHEEALQEFEKAAELEPENPEVASRVRDARRALALAANEEGKTLAGMKDYLGAIVAFKKAIRYHSEEASYIQNLKRATKEQLSLGQKAVEEKEFPKAIEIFDKTLKELPSHKKLKEARQDAEMAWANKLYEEAKEYQGRGLHGNALISLVHLRRLVGTYRDSAALEVAARDQVSDAARFGITIRAGKAKRKTAELTRDIVDRLRAVKLGKCPTARLPASGEPRLTVQLTLKEIRFSQNRDIQTGEQKYQSGIRKVDNPKFLDLKKSITDNRIRTSELEEMLKQDARVIEESRQAFADAGPDDDEESLRKRLVQAEKEQAAHQQEIADREKKVVEARALLSKTPRKLDEPVYDTYTYEKYKITRTGTAVVEMAARGEGGVRLTRGEVEGSASTSDETNPADRAHGVVADPLEFPKTDDQVREEALKQVVAELGQRLDGLCERWREEILSRARQASTASPMEATEDYVLYLFVRTDPPPPEVEEFLKRERNFMQAGELRGKP